MSSDQHVRGCVIERPRTGSLSVMDDKLLILLVGIPTRWHHLWRFAGSQNLGCDEIASRAEVKSPRGCRKSWWKVTPVTCLLPSSRSFHIR